jgi:hypothetical protein
MKELEAAGLFGGGLVPVRSAAMRGRYNRCLEAAGIAPTALTHFHLDAKGFSPEVAAEKGDPDYLSQGEANQVAVILSPDQRHRPVYNPVFSFERAVLAAWFDRNLDAVADLTAETGLWLELDLGVSAFRAPKDLLLVDAVKVRTASVSPLIQASIGQRKLAARFMSGGADAWFDPDLRAALIASVKEHGDLRGRDMATQDIAFTETRCFFTRAFGGVFVLRGRASARPLMVFTGECPPEEATGDARAMRLDDPRLFEILQVEGLVQFDAAAYAADPSPVARIMEALLADAVAAAEPESDFAGMTGAQRKAVIRRLGKALPDAYFGLERFAKALAASPGEAALVVTPPLRALLFQPAAGLPPVAADVMWRLLVRRSPLDVLRMYMHDKPFLYERFGAWPSAKKGWAAAVLRRSLPPPVAGRTAKERGK